MSVFGRVRELFGGVERKEAVGLLDPAAWAFFGSGAQTSSGASVGPHTALKVPAVSAAVQLISNSVSTLPASIFVNDGQSKAADTSHPATAIVEGNSNPWTASSELRRQLTIDALTHAAIDTRVNPPVVGAGFGYALAVRVNGRVRELHRIAPETVQNDYAADGSPAYRITTANGTSLRSWRDVLVVEAPGGCPVHHAREAIGLAMVLETHAGRLFGRSARPSGLLKFDTKLDADTAARIKASWQAAHAGENSGGTAVLEAGGSFQPLSFSSVDAQFQEARSFQILEIARAFNVPASMIGDHSHSTFSNSLEFRQQFLTFGLLPWLRAWQAAYERVLLADNELETHSIEFVVDDFLRADTASRAEAYSLFRAAGVYTSNELRKLENLPPLPGGDTLESPHVQSAGKPMKVAA